MAFSYLSLLEVAKVSRHLVKTIIFKKDFFLGQRTMGTQTFFSKAITRNLELISNDKLNMDAKAGKLHQLKMEKNRPLAVLFEWISADKKHFYKYSNLYLERGYDVLAVSLSVRQLLWPISGSQIVASEALEFLNQNPLYNPLLVHGFSIGGYVWGEVLVLMDKDLPKYQPIINRIKGQIWDSTPDVTEFHKGFPKAIFPNNGLFRLAFEKSLGYHLKIFYETATKHYVNASKLFHDTPLKSPALLFVAKNDPVASYQSISKLREYWDTQGMKTNLKSWDRSKHVSHLRFHQEEYIKSLDVFLASLNENKSQEKEKKESEKITAKL